MYNGCAHTYTHTYTCCMYMFIYNVYTHIYIYIYNGCAAAFSDGISLFSGSFQHNCSLV